MRAVIEIRDTPANTPKAFLEPDGRLLVDLGEDFEFSLSIAATEGNDVNELKREGTQSFQVPLTDKNKWIFRRWIHPNIFARDYTRMSVYAYDGPYQLTEDALDVLSVDIGEGTLEAGLFESPLLGVVDAANELFLDQVNFGTFEFSLANLEANWLSPEWDKDTGDDVYFGLVHYGNFIIDQYEVSPEDFRPLLSVPGTLLRGFCTIGWAFDTPLFESAWFNRLWWYGLGPEYYKHSDWGRLARFDVEVTEDINAATPPLQIITFGTENYDIGNNHEALAPGSLFTRTQPLAGIMKYRITGQIDNYSGAQTFNLSMVVSGSGGLNSFPFSAGAGEVLDIDLSIVEDFPQGSQFSVVVGAFSFPMTIKAGFKITAEPTGKYYHRGDIIEIRESIHPDYTFLDFLQGLAHMGFRFDIQHGIRKITMYQPEAGEVFAEGPFDGYFRPAHEAKDWNASAQHNTVAMAFPKEDIPETLVFAFKESTDEFIKEKALREDAPLYSQRVTFPSGVRRELEVNNNPFFEPTANTLWFGDAEPELSTPAMWDNAQKKRSFEIGARILYAEGHVFQSSQSGAPKQWSYDGALRDEMPFVFQVPEAGVGPENQVPDGYVVYGGMPNSIWQMFLRKDNRLYRDLPRVSLLMNFNNVDYHLLSFRDRVIVDVMGRPTIFKLLAVEDFKTGNFMPTPIAVQVDPNEVC